MNKLDQLINELCPEGVEHVELGKFASITRGGNFQKKDFTEKGKPCIHYGQIYTKYGLFAKDAISLINEKVFQKQKKAVQNDIIMAVTSENVEDVCKCVAWLGEEEVAISGHTAIIHHSQNAKYLVYYFHSSLFLLHKVKLAHGTKVIEVKPDSLKNIRIPLPPLPVQAEIVRILDNLTELTAELTTELTTELTARRQQYEYYRNSLLTFGDEVEKFKLGELFEFKNGLNKGKEFFGKGTPIVNFTDVYHKGKLKSTNLHGKVLVTEGELLRYEVRKGDVFFTRTSETKEDIGMVSAMVEDIDNCVFSGFVLRARPKTQLLLPDYCAYCFSSLEIRNLIVRMSSFTTRALTSGTILSKIEIPVPPIVEQQRIVDILDRFDKLCNDISVGLPAEIKAREQQYEYYRDKLLTFKEKEVCENE